MRTSSSYKFTLLQIKKAEFCLPVSSYKFSIFRIHFLFLGGHRFIHQVTDASFTLRCIGIVTLSPLEMEQKSVTIAWLNDYFTKDKDYFVTITNS
jgi:hypothetical protein